jgi:hypothetical protein
LKGFEGVWDLWGFGEDLRGFGEDLYLTLRGKFLVISIG